MKAQSSSKDFQEVDLKINSVNKSMYELADGYIQHITHIIKHNSYVANLTYIN